MQICVQATEPFIVHIFSHILDDVRTNIVDVVDGIDFDETAAPNLCQLGLLEERQIANHMIVNGTATVFVLELDDRHIPKIRIPPFHSQHELAEILIAGNYVLDVKRHLVVKRKGDKLGTVVEITAN